MSDRTCLVAGGDLEKSQMEPAMEIYGRIFGENCTYHVTPYDGIAEMLEQLKKSGIKLAVLSNKPHLQAVDVVKEFFRGRCFFICSGTDRQCTEKAGSERSADDCREAWM